MGTKFRKLMGLLLKNTEKPYLFSVHICVSWKKICLLMIGVILSTRSPFLRNENYHQAFYRHDPDRFSEYISDVKSGKQTIKSSTLFPYDLVKNILTLEKFCSGRRPVTEAQWKALPNYVEGNKNIMVMADIGFYV